MRRHALLLMLLLCIAPALAQVQDRDQALIAAAARGDTATVGKLLSAGASR